MKTRIAVVTVAAVLTVLASSDVLASTGSPGAVTPGPGSVRVPGPGDDPAGSGVGARPAAQMKLPDRSDVVLATGDHVRLDVDETGTQSVTTGGQGENLVHFTSAGDEYAVPAAAVGYLNTTLDPRLFDVSYLVRAGLDQAHSAALPIKITYSGSGPVPALPGVHVISRSGVTATATVISSEAPKLGQLLTDQARLTRTGKSTVPAGHLQGVRRIELAPAASAPPLPAALPSAGTAQATPHKAGARYRTVTLNFIDLNGDPGAAAGWLQNVDDANAGFTEFGNSVGGDSGPVSFSVPEGTYSVAFSVMTPHANDDRIDTALVVKPQVTVTSDQTITLDARTAEPVEVTMDRDVTPGLRLERLDLSRVSATGGGFGGADLFNLTMGLITESAPNWPFAKLLATPTTTPVTKGSLGFAVTTGLLQARSDAEPATPPASYFLNFPHTGTVPSVLSYRVRAADLTTVHHHVYDHSGAAAACGYDASDLHPVITMPWGSSLSPTTLPYDYVQPGDYTEYRYSSDPTLDRWQTAYDDAPNCMRIYGARSALVPGQQLDESWSRAPYTPAPAVAAAHEAGQGAGLNDRITTVCPACRQDDNAFLFLQPFGDSDPSHHGEIERTAANSLVRFFRNGTLALSIPQNPSNLPLPMLAEPADYELAWTASPARDETERSETQWTFHSARTDTSTLPAGEICAPDRSRGCSFLPLLFISYDLALDTMSRAKAGVPFRIAFGVGAQQNAPAPKGVTATVSASFDDGKTWTSEQPAEAGANGKFSTTITHPARTDGEQFVSLRVTARDAAGNTVRQTNIHAYALTN
ncbi:hypothetical protein AB0L70_00020 [Kribbella sp. NPDC051952]|uniref:hypothetical protein n=1 Tax=Kribbella sp. NPDC051952 TaxID=3154851 RepID=UPI00344744A5